MRLKKPMNGYVEASFKALQPDNNQPDVVVIEGYATKAVVDRDGDLVLPKNIDLSDFNKNPIVLFNHDPKHPIGKVLDVKPTKEGLLVKVAIYKDMDDKVFNGVKNEILKTFSIGFSALEGEYDEKVDAFVFTKTKLFELSVVSVPANADAIFDVVQTCENGQCSLAKKGLKLENQEINSLETKTIKNKKVSDKKWSEVDKTALKSFVLQKGKAYVEEAFLVVPDPELKSTWKFPHHEADGNDLILNRGGVIAAWASLMGARQKPNLSPEQKLKAAKHLLKHYRVLKQQELVDEIPQELLDMTKSLEDEVIKLYSDEVETKGAKLDKSKVLQLINDNEDTSFGAPIKGGVKDEYMVNRTAKSMLTAYPNPPEGYMITRYIATTGNAINFVIGKTEIAELLDLMSKVFKDRDDKGNKKAVEVEEKKSVNPVEVVKELWGENPDEALKAFTEIEKFINLEVTNLLNTNKGE